MYKSENTATVQKGGETVVVHNYCAEGLTLEELDALKNHTCVNWFIRDLITYFTYNGGFTTASVTLTENIKAVMLYIPMDANRRDFSLTYHSIDDGKVDGVSNVKLELTLNPCRLYPDFTAFLNNFFAQMMNTGYKLGVTFKEDGTIRFLFYFPVGRGEYYGDVWEWYNGMEKDDGEEAEREESD